MDIASVMGILFGIVMVIFGITSDTGGFTLLGNFIHIPSVIITIGGSLSGVLAANKLTGFINGFTSFRLAFRKKQGSPEKVIGNIIYLSEIARKEGLLALEELAERQEDRLLRKGLMLVVDGTDPELIRRICETYLDGIEARHEKVISFWDKWGELAPAWGMIGTLIGLVNMLKNMQSDSSAIGPNMSTALITTFYGSIISNWICNPVASKLREQHDEEMMYKEMMVEGILSIQAGENPRLIQEKLIIFLPQKMGEKVIAEVEIIMGRKISEGRSAEYQGAEKRDSGNVRRGNVNLRAGGESV